MALVYVGGASANGTSGDFTVPLDALTGGVGTSAQPGDLVVVATGFIGTTDGDPGVTTAGYTELTDLYADSVRDSNFAVAIKRLNAAETSVTCRGSGIASNAAGAAIHVWRGANETNPLDVAIETATVAASRVIKSPPISPITPGAIILSAGIAVSSAAMNSATAPLGYENQVYTTHDPGQAVGVGIASIAWDGAGPHDPPIWRNTGSATNDSFAAATIVLRPAASAVSHDRAAAVAGATAVAAARTVSRVRAGAVVSASAVSASATVSRARAAAVIAASEATAVQAITRARAAAVAASSTVDASYIKTGAITASAAIGAASSVSAQAVRILARGATVIASSDVQASAGGLFLRAANVTSGSVVQAVPFVGVIVRRHASPGETRGGTIITEQRGGTLSHTARSGTIIRG